jgi:hypothetical protein
VIIRLRVPLLAIIAIAILATRKPHVDSGIGYADPAPPS